jgi:predicted TIM-barrel fold metal-dependent hydrolase
MIPDVVKLTTMGFLSNAQAIAELIVSGLCARYPALNFVSVESGFGYIPYLLEALDWQWINYDATNLFPDRLLPSEYFRRQIYTTFWFETESMTRVVDLYPDNVMFETDYPHPTCIAPGPASMTDSARNVIEQNLHTLPDVLLRKLLFENAARLYGINAH